MHSSVSATASFLGRRRPVSSRRITLKPEHPFPLKYVITSRDEPQAPESIVELRNWDLSPQLTADVFRFTPPRGAQEVSFLAPERGEPRAEAPMTRLIKKGKGLAGWAGVALALSGGGLLEHRDLSLLSPNLLLLNEAEAQYGTSRRVARRTARRTSYRHEAWDLDYAAAPAPAASYVTALPGGCAATLVGSVTYHRCGATYYRPYMQGSTVVYVVEEP
jgi:hypothetical protein